MHNATSRSSLVVSKSLAMASAFAFPGIYVCVVGILISVGMIASIPYVRANRDILVRFQLVDL